MRTKVEYAINYNDIDAVERLLPLYDESLGREFLHDLIEENDFPGVYALITLHELRISNGKEFNYPIAILSRNEDIYKRVSFDDEEEFYYALQRVITELDLDTLIILAKYADDKYWKRYFKSRLKHLNQREMFLDTLSLTNLLNQVMKITYKER